MKQLLILFLLQLSLLYTKSQNSQDACVQVNASINELNHSITLNWFTNVYANQYIIKKKSINSSSWGNPIATVSGNSFVDTNIVVGETYEYQIAISGNISAYGYLIAGIKIPLIENRGGLILLIDSTLNESLYNEIKTLVSDLEGDGYHVFHHQVSRNAAVTTIKDTILQDYNAFPNLINSVLLLGHIPVPYSGNINPDGHPDHKGAWPCDAFYGDINGTWTDNAINTTTAGDIRNQNIPGDGKFDQSYFPSEIELQVGRIDFVDMPGFLATEVELMRSYLVKNHEFKLKLYSPQKRALIEDNFGYFSGEAFAASGWRNFSSLVGNENVTSGDFLSDLSANNYLWAYGCGPGYYTGASGIGSSEQLAGSELNATFTMLFGSYFGDWDNSNNFMRAILAQGKVLTCSWAGRPHWAFHHMTLGNSIGNSTLITQNNINTYNAGYGAQMVHMSLLGDPTLRNDVVAPATNLVTSMYQDNFNINWTPSTDSVLGYNIYRKKNNDFEFLKLNTDLIQETNFNDLCISDTGHFIYMVKAIKLENTPSGTYYNNSIGITDTIFKSNSFIASAIATFEINGDSVNFTNESENSTNYLWQFNDQPENLDFSPSFGFTDLFFSARLIASNSCNADTAYFSGELPVLVEKLENTIYSIFPNPADNEVSIYLKNINYNNLEVIDQNGKLIFKKMLNTDLNKIDIYYLCQGVYTIILSNNVTKIFSKLVVQ
jgi:nitrate reductase NapAB chaperone NapD